MKCMMNDFNQNLPMIRALCDAFGPSGFEEEVLDVIRRFGEGLGRFEEDRLRNLYLYRKENRPGRPVLMLDAHTDELGFMVRDLLPDGTLRVVTLGGWDRFALPSSRVTLRNERGDHIPGIMASKPYMYMDAAQRSQGPLGNDQLALDVGSLCAEQTAGDFGIQVGDPAAPEAHFSYDEVHGLFHGKAFDCRLGCAALLETLRRLEGEELPFYIVAVFTSQEEVGTRGVKAAVERVNPQIAFCFEGPPADDTMGFMPRPQTALGKGPMLRFMDGSVICSPRYMRYVLRLAQDRGIPVQTNVRTIGANDGGVIHTACGGVPVVVAGIPVRYNHTCNNLARMDDYEATVALAAAVIRSLTEQDLQNF